MSSTFKEIKLCILIIAALIGQAHAEDTSDLNPKLTARAVCGGNQKSLEILGGSKINPLSLRLQAIGKSYFDSAMSHFKEGEGEEEKIKDGITQLEQAVAVQYPPAQVQFALFHITGEYGIKKDERFAVKLLKRAATQGNSDALFNLGSFYELRAREEQERIRIESERLAVAYYQRDANEGDEEFSSRLAGLCERGFCHEDGRIITENERLAVAYYQRAAAREHAGALASLGDLYARGSCGRNPDIKQAASHYRVAYYWKSAQNKEAQDKSDKKPLLSHTPEAGENDFELAMKSFENDEIENGLKQLKQSADMKYGLALVELGFLYQTGKYGIEKDENLAVTLYKSAWGKKCSKAGVMLANLSENGLCGMKKSPYQALVHYRAAYVLESIKKRNVN